jgi:hypothetical protein
MATSVDPTILATAIATKKAHDATTKAKTATDKTWNEALVFLNLSPAPRRPTIPNRPVSSTTPTVPTVIYTTSQLQSLADAKVAADTAVAGTLAPYQAAQAALTKALKDAGAQ